MAEQGKNAPRYQPFYAEDTLNKREIALLGNALNEIITLQEEADRIKGFRHRRRICLKPIPAEEILAQTLD